MVEQDGARDDECDYGECDDGAQERSRYLLSRRRFISSGKSNCYELYRTLSNKSKRTVIGARMSHRKWRETKQQLISWPDLALRGCSLVSLHFQYDILAPITVQPGASGCSKGLADYFISVPQDVGPTLQLQYCPQRKTIRRGGNSRAGFLRRLSHGGGRFLRCGITQILPKFVSELRQPASRTSHSSALAKKTELCEVL